MRTYRLTRQADRNLGDIYLYAAERFGTRQADRYADELEHVFGLLASHPLMGRAADRIRPGLHRPEHAGHVIFYRPGDEGVLIVAIVCSPHAARPRSRELIGSRFESPARG